LLCGQDCPLQQQQSEGDSRTARLGRLALEGHQFRDLTLNRLLKAAWTAIPLAADIHPVIPMSNGLEQSF
jgi:hypothetical protein